MSAGIDERERRPALAWRRGLAWLALLGPFFYLSYGVANHLAAQRADVPSVVFDFEYSIPFWAWTILPYWTVNAFYVGSLFVHRSAQAVDVQGRRLLTAQLIAVSCFLLWPLRFSFERPETSGWAGFMFDALTSFDKPYNQAPSLHIALLLILWVVYAPRLARLPRWGLHLWFALIGLSVLTTYQHHFIDIPTGLALGAFCLWLWPEHGRSPLAGLRFADDPARRVLAIRYASGALVLIALAALLRGIALWLLWPALSLSLVALAYAAAGRGVFQKSAQGRLSVGAALLLAPYLLAARLNQWAWTRGEPAQQAVADGVHLGRLPWRRASSDVPVLIDLSAELDAPRGARVQAFPCLDLVAPDPQALRQAADAIERLRLQAPLRVACALGRSRSACAVAVWLLRTKRAATVDRALARLRDCQPGLVIGPAQRDAIKQAARDD